MRPRTIASLLNRAATYYAIQTIAEKGIDEAAAIARRAEEAAKQEDDGECPF